MAAGQRLGFEPETKRETRNLRRPAVWPERRCLTAEKHHTKCKARCGFGKPRPDPTTQNWTPRARQHPDCTRGPFRRKEGSTTWSADWAPLPGPERASLSQTTGNLGTSATLHKEHRAPHAGAPCCFFSAPPPCQQRAATRAASKKLRSQFDVLHALRLEARPLTTEAARRGATRLAESTTLTVSVQLVGSQVRRSGRRAGRARPARGQEPP